MDLPKAIVISAVMVCVTLAGVAYFIWPTPYTYQVIHKVVIGSDKNYEQLYRVHRFTGETTLVHDALSGTAKDPLPRNL